MRMVYHTRGVTWLSVFDKREENRRRKKEDEEEKKKITGKRVWVRDSHDMTIVGFLYIWYVYNNYIIQMTRIPSYVYTYTSRLPLKLMDGYLSFPACQQYQETEFNSTLLLEHVLVDP